MADEAGLLGLPLVAVSDVAGAKVAVIGAPCGTPYEGAGAFCAGAPPAIRAAMARYAPSIGHFDFDLGGPLLGEPAARAVDCGDLAWREADAAGNRAAIGAAVGRLLDAGAAPVLIGGDDSVQIPAFAAQEGRGPFWVLQVDAHIDWRDEVGGERLGLSSTMRRVAEMGYIAGMVQVGQRATGSARPSDVADALAYGARLVRAEDVHVLGVEHAAALVPEGAQVIVAFDCDALDPAFMPGVAAPSPGGLAVWQVVRLLRAVAARARIAAFHLVEFVPERDVEGLGALAAGRVLANAIGAMARG